MRPDLIDWKFGEIVFWELGFLDALRPLAEQLEGLKEDLAQVKYGDKVLDVGWYPEFSDEGEFVVTVVHGGNWDEPLFRESGRTVDSLLRSLKAAIMVARGAL